MKNASGKKILTIHGIFSKHIDQLHGKTSGNLSRKYENDALNWADAITVISKEAYDYYSNLGYKVFQVPNAIDISSFDKKEDRRHEKQIIFAGRLSKEKGIDSLIKIANNLPQDTHLMILGTGPEEEKIKNLEKSQNNVHFLGYQSKENTIALIAGSDILIQPSLKEGISSTILEAMALKTAVITSSVGGTNEFIENGKNGISIEPSNITTFTEKIDQLLENNTLRKSIIHEAQETVKKYDWSQVGNLYLSIYESMLNDTK